MQVLNLSDVKVQLSVTFTAQDAKITGLIERTEAEVLGYCNLLAAGAFDALYARVGEVGLSQLEAACMRTVELLWRDATADIWKGGYLARTLFPYRLPAISPGSTS